MAPAGAPAGDASLGTVKQKASYAIGVSIAENLKQAHVDVDMQTLMKGLTDSLTGGKLAMTDKEMGEAVQQFQKEQDTKASDKNKKDGAKFLADNKSKEGVKTTASGLQYKVLKSGTGATPGPNDEVTAHYKGTLLDGKVFDSSYDRGEPIHIQANRVIKGWTEALQLMKVGDKWQLFVPAELAYGDQGAPPDHRSQFSARVRSRTARREKGRRCAIIRCNCSRCRRSNSFQLA